MDTHNWRRYKEIAIRRKLVDKRLERELGIAEETKNKGTIWKKQNQEKRIKNCDWRTKAKDAGKKRKSEKIWAKVWSI